MAQLHRLIWAGALAGLLVGLVITVVQSVTVYPLLRHAEQFEHAEPPAHDHASGQDAGHAHAPAWEPTGTLERLGFGALTNIVVGAGFGLLLAGLFGLRDGPVGLRRGCAWGAAGFLCFALAPALGLPPALPGAAEAALPARQLWWLLTAVSTAAGLAAIVLGDWRWRIAGLALLVLPHAVGAPRPDELDSTVPATLAHSFVVLSLGTSALFWVLLGGTAGWLYDALRNRDRASPSAG